MRKKEKKDYRKESKNFNEKKNIYSKNLYILFL